MKLIILLLSFSAGALAVLNVTLCDNKEYVQQEITVGKCKRGTCRLRKGTNIPVQIKFTALEDIPSMRNKVFAVIVGVPFPFIGFDGTDACATVFKEDGKTKVDCPLKKGETYVYKNVFEIFDIYPRIHLIVHFEIEAPNQKSPACFETPARITN